MSLTVFFILTDKFETSDEIKYVKWVQALTKEAVPHNHQQETYTSSDDDDVHRESQTDADDETGDSDSNDDGQLASIANKFAALAGDD